MLTACNNDVIEHGQMLEFEVWDENGIVRIDFETAEATYFEMEGSDQDGIALQLNEADLAEYRTFATGYSDPIFTKDKRLGTHDSVHNNQSHNSNSDAERVFWKVIATYDDGTLLVHNGFGGYPDDWNVLAEKTNALVGFHFMIILETDQTDQDKTN